MLQKISFKDKNKKSLNNDQRILSDININQIKHTVNAVIDYINNDTGDDFDQEKVYTKQQVDILIEQAKDNIISQQSLEQINDDLFDLTNMIKDL